MMRLKLAMLFLGCLVANAHAQSKLSDLKKGRDFNLFCQASATEAQKSYLSGYVTGSADASMGKHFCPKEAVSTQSIVDGFCKYLAAHPKQLAQPGGLLLGQAFSEGWPCR